MDYGVDSSSNTFLLNANNRESPYSSTLAWLISVCCTGWRLQSVHRQSTSHHRTDRGHHLTLTISRADLLASALCDVLSIGITSTYHGGNSQNTKRPVSTLDDSNLASCDSLLSSCKAPTTADIDASVLHSFFDPTPTQPEPRLYLAETLHLIAYVDLQGHLRSTFTSAFLVPPMSRITLGDRAFPVAAVRAWNALSAIIRLASSYLTFRQRLKTFLFTTPFDVSH